MDDYPNSEEEFELMYGDELDLLREQEDLESGNYEPKDNSQRNVPLSQQTNVSVSDHNVSSNIAELQLSESIETSYQPSNSQVSTAIPVTGTKRSIQELFGDIDDILSEEFVDGQFKKRKTRQDIDNLALIDHILELRKQARELRNPLSVISSDPVLTSKDYYKDNVSFLMPRYSSVCITRNDGQKVYVRCHSEEYEKQETSRMITKGIFSDIMGKTFKEIWKEANKLINDDLIREENPSSENSSDLFVLKEVAQNNANLWVDLYKPTKYIELLSDESTNRTLLRWLKLWDKIVFKRKPKVKIINKKNDVPFNKFQKESNFTIDEKGYPEQKVVLLCGPPGLGKTTLAHLVARHAGYNVVEVNASDDRSTEKFKTILDNATQMRSIIDKENRPNCLIFDEIDGAPLSSIEYLIKYINGTAKPKKKKGSSGAIEKTNMLKRPIICICNDVYVPALRPLRQIAYVVNFPPTASARLADRLNEIARHQNIKTDLGALLALCEKSGNDIRCCLSVLHFFKALSKPVTLSQVYKTSVGQKDMQKGLFTVWQEIFQIRQPTHVEMVTNSDKETNQGQKHSKLSNRMKRILQIVNSFGDYERLAQGVFENYVSMDNKDSILSGTCEALEWFCYTDILNKQIYSLQNYTLLSYLPYAFVVWHYMFAKLTWQKLNYPNAGFEAKVKANKNSAILAEIMKGMQPAARAFTYSSSLLLDTLPILSRIIIPSLRPVNLHLYTEEEKRQLHDLVSVMIDYNLNYVQERTPEGTYSFNLDPNIHDLVLFSNSKVKHILSYANKQLVTRELEVEKMRRVEYFKNGCDNKTGIEKNDSNKKTEKTIPNHLQKLKTVKPKKAPMVTKDFFGRIITKPSDLSTTDDKHMRDIWFQYKEGYTNAVRKKIKVSSLK